MATSTKPQPIDPMGQPLDLDEVAIVRENAQHEQRVLAESSPRVVGTVTGPSLMDAFKAIRNASNCPTCGKSTVVANVKAAMGLKGTQLERVGPDTHCTCKGGPAEPVDLDAFVRSAFDAAAFATQDVAFEGIAAALAAKAHRPLLMSERRKVGIAVTFEWQRRHAREVPALVGASVRVVGASGR